MNQIEKVLDAMEGLSYPEWIKLKLATDELFRLRVENLQKEVRIIDSKELKEAIRLRFGGR